MIVVGSVYRGLETDSELLARVQIKAPWYNSCYSGPDLDDEVWACFKMQRRIVERATSSASASMYATR